MLSRKNGLGEGIDMKLQRGFNHGTNETTREFTLEQKCIPLPGSWPGVKF